MPAIKSIVFDGKGSFVVVSGQAAFGLETLKADMAVHRLDHLLSKISIEEQPFRIVSGSSRPI